uniref:Protein kinase domain-containing protein n=1 Tax=Macrostomum lignano TaxID=282301 RepID=A0A1I8F475_9PLAT
MERLHHPCVIRLYEVMESVAKIHIVMEYAPGGELFTKITSEGRFSERHGPGDFLSSGFGHQAHGWRFRIQHSGQAAAGAQHLLRLAAAYAAPELFRDDSYQGPRVDIWALGIMLYFMLTGLMPFRADTVGRLKKLILAGEYSMPAFLLSPPDRATMSDIQSSAWLEGEEFLPALEKYEMNPRRVANRADLRPEELEVHKRESGEITFTPPSSAALSRQERQRGGGGGGGEAAVAEAAVTEQQQQAAATGKQQSMYC